LEQKLLLKKITVKDEREMILIKREVDTLKDIRHPNIVQFYGICKQDDSLLLVQEFIACGELYKLLKDTKIDIDWRWKVSMAKDSASGMSYLHSKNIIHRDLKSENLLVDEQKRIKICDFGLATVPRNRQMTVKIGSPFFMAPEILLGKQYNEKADVFSYGVVLVEIVTRANAPPDTMERSASSGYTLNFDKLRPHIPPECPPEFLKLARLCLRVSPDERPTFKQALDILKAIQEHYKLG